MRVKARTVPTIRALVRLFGQQAEQQQEASQHRLELAKRKLVAEAESARVEKERVLRMQVRCRKMMWLHETLRVHFLVVMGEMDALVYSIRVSNLVQWHCQAGPSFYLPSCDGRSG